MFGISDKECLIYETFAHHSCSQSIELTPFLTCTGNLLLSHKQIS